MVLCKSLATLIIQGFIWIFILEFSEFFQIFVGNIEDENSSDDTANGRNKMVAI